MSNQIGPFEILPECYEQCVRIDVTRNANRLPQISEWCTANAGEFTFGIKEYPNETLVWSVGLLDSKLVFWLPNKEVRTEFILKWMD